MVKKGPCLHCGTNCTPLWRNGPAEKPVLCNACGSRYNLKGNLDNYLPKNVQLHLDDSENVHGTSSNDLSVDEDQLSNNVPPNPIGEATTNLWNLKIPSRKRTRVEYRRMTPMELFHKQLLNLMRSEKQPNDSSPEEILLLENVNNFIPSNEIGLGCILLNSTDVTSTAQGSSSTCSSTNN